MSMRSLIVAAALVAVLGLAACSAKAPVAADANAAAQPASGPAATSDSAPNYPDWAKAAVPPYPNVVVAIPVNTAMYQFQSADDPATVLAWYKQHLSGTWTKDATADVWSATVGGVQVSVSKNTVTSTPDAAAIKTIVMVSRRS
jgi:hypothetical protein